MVELLQSTTVLASIASDRTVVEKIIEETEMTMESVAEFYMDTPFGHIIRDSGRAEGVNEGREELLTALLVERFGEQADVKEAAHRFATWSNAAAAVHAISTATAFDDLPDTESPA